MISLVVVSHSHALATAACEFAMLMATEEQPQVEIAAGSRVGEFGTSPRLIVDAIAQAANDEGVLVFVDLGSAALNAEMALDQLAGADFPIRISVAPFVEGLVAAVATAASGGTLDEVDAEASRAVAVKTASLGLLTTRRWSGWDDASTMTETCRIVGEHGLHARPAARLANTVSGFDAQVRLRNVSAGGSFVSASSITELMTLGATRGDVVLVEACGEDAAPVLEAVVAILGTGEDDSPPALVSVASGLGVGRGARRVRHGDSWADAEYPTSSVAVELERLRSAQRAVASELRAVVERDAPGLDVSAAEVVESLCAVLDDTSLMSRVEADIAAGAGAMTAWTTNMSRLVTQVDSVVDSYQRQRAVDLADLRDRVASRLAGIGEPAGQVTTSTGELIVYLADELSAAEVASLDRATCAAIVTTRGSQTSHAAILARSLGIPTLVGASPELLAAMDDRIVLVDARAASVIVDPSSDEIDAARHDPAGIPPEVDGPTMHQVSTLDGRRLLVTANVSSEAQALESTAEGADGVGLLRTEFLFARHRVAPSADEHASAYERIAAVLDGRPLTIRTFDGAADKPLHFLGVHDHQRLRGLGLTLHHQPVLLAQLGGVTRAAARCPEIRLIFPFVSHVRELDQVLELLDEAMALEQAAGHEVSRPSVGAMIENPFAVLDLEQLRSRVDFLSVGTNDLATSLPGNDHRSATSTVSYAIDPRVLGLIQRVTEQAVGIPVSVCGELASDLDAVPLLIGLGVDQLSVRPSWVPAVKRQIERWTLGGAIELAARALEQRDSSSVHELVRTTRAALDPSR